MIDDILKLLKSSIDKSIELKLFKNKDKSSYVHLYNYEFKDFSLAKIKKGLFKNYNTNRLKAKSEENAYPENDRPKGIYNIEADKFHRKLHRPKRKMRQTFYKK